MKNKIIYIFFGCFSILIIFVNIYAHITNDEIPPREYAKRHILSKMANELYTKYNLKLTVTGGSVDKDKITFLSFYVTENGIKDIKYLRQLLIKISIEF